MIDFEKLYTSSLDFKIYVDKYCVKHGISRYQALTHYLVQMAGVQYLEQEKQI